MLSKRFFIISCIVILVIIASLMLYTNITETNFDTNVNITLVKPEMMHEMEHYAIIYAYAPGEHRDENFEFFLRHGIPQPCPPHINIYIIVNGVDGLLERFRPLLRFLPQVHVWSRENMGYDFCAWKFALDRIQSMQLRPSYFVMLNGSVRGPFFPSYARHAIFWADHFKLLMRASKNAKLAGLTINCQPMLHIQSMFLIFHASILDIVQSTIGCFADKDEVIQRCEVGLSQRVLAGGHNLAVMQSFWYKHDFVECTIFLNPCLISRMGGSIKKFRWVMPI
jgi:hypothetical protein